MINKVRRLRETLVCLKNTVLAACFIGFPDYTSIFSQDVKERNFSFAYKSLFKIKSKHMD